LKANSQQTLAANENLYVVGDIGLFGNMLNAGNINIAPTASIFFLNPATLWENTTATATFTNTGKIIFKGATTLPSQQTIRGGYNTSVSLTQPAFPSIELDNTAHVQLEFNQNTGTTRGSAYVLNNINFINGSLFVNDQNLVLSSTATLTNTNTTNKYVITNFTSNYQFNPNTGYLRKNGLTNGQSFTFPVGRALNDYTPAVITQGSTTQDIAVQVKNFSETATFLFLANTQNSIDRLWTIIGSSGAGINMTLTHNTSTNGTAYNTNYSTQAFITKYDNSDGRWDKGPTPWGETNVVSGTQTLSRLTPMTATSAGIDGYYTKAIASINGTVLPFISINLYGSLSNNIAKLRWEVVTDKDISHYEILKSNDAINFHSITRTTAINNSLRNKIYTTEDSSILNNEKYYYRIKAVGNDGRVYYSNIVFLEKQNIKINYCSIYPNPTKNNFNIYINAIANEKALVRVFNTYGSTIIERKVEVLKGANSFSINEIAKHGAGYYTVQIKIGAEIFNYKLIVQ
jgi:hypothetical protein